MQKIFFLILFISCGRLTYAQTNYYFTNAVVPDILKGNYNTALYNSSTAATAKSTIMSGLYSGVNTDSLLFFLKQMASFTTRNTGSDTVSNYMGIGAARRWAHQQFERFATTYQNRLQVSYFQFDKIICAKNQHRNIMAVLPGTDTSDKSFILVEAHLDSRCENVCDSICLAQGMEDNGSGCALVLELARVLSMYTYKRSLVFMLTIGEEQGLDGADAFAKYCRTNALTVRAVFNNDIVGGIICGKSASPPGCPGENEQDSINVRIFSAGTNSSQHKGLARFVKLEFEEEMKHLLNVKTNVNIMNAEDRTGRGGDHIPFRQQNYTAIRFTSANEHGDANPQAGYQDRQHSTRDVLGKDFNNDGLIDSFYVSTTYLQRNCLLNGTALTMLANGPNTPDFELINDGNGLGLVIKNPVAPNNYRIGFRSKKNDFDTLFTIKNQIDFKTYQVKTDSIYFVSVARMDDENIESLFAVEKFAKVLWVPPAGVLNVQPLQRAMQLLPVSPNPVDETISFTVWMKDPGIGKNGLIEVFDMQGKLIKRLPLSLSKEINEVLFEHGFNAKGLYYCTLFVDGLLIDSQKLFFK
ncbi:MAG: M28 family peptidase [Bacteroidia bacterium]|nr:M28 family peptidase [Bacteroidia bacterium]